MNSPQIGLVIPIIQRRYILNLIKIIKETVIDFEIVICVVNDGNNKIKKYLCNQLPLDVELLNLEKNVCFAGANNAGWKFLLNKFPSIKYLGTINDDTIPRYKWLNYLVQSMEVNSSIGACAPVMITHTNHIYKRKEVFSSTWKLGGEKNPMFLDQEKINNDTNVSVLGGFCFIAKAEVLLQVDFFDERYKNSCEDIDLSIKLRKNGWDLVISHKSYVIHKCGKSRFKKNSNTNVSDSRRLLFFTWGNKLDIYNL